MPRSLLQSALPVVLLVAAFAPSALASTISYTGNLRTDANVTSCGAGCTLGSADTDADYAQYAAVVESFTLFAASTVQITSFSYGGGTNGNGVVIAEGGLEPYVSLFDQAGDFLASTYYGVTCPTGAKINTTSGQCYDVLLDAGTHGPGTYQVALSAFENMSFAENYGTGALADGFTGLGNLALGEDLHYAFDVDITAPTTPPSPVPEPTTGSLVALALLGVRLVRRRHDKTSRMTP